MHIRLNFFENGIYLNFVRKSLKKNIGQLTRESFSIELFDETAWGQKPQFAIQWPSVNVII